MTNDDELRKDVFAWYGSVVYTAQCFEVELCNLLLAHKRLDNPETSSEELDKLDEILMRKTLGQLINEVKKRFRIHPEFETLLKQYLQKRNYISHRFFFENSKKLISTDGCQQLISELQDLCVIFREADAVSQQMSKNVRIATGIDEDAFMEMVNREVESARDKK